MAHDHNKLGRRSGPDRSLRPDSAALVHHGEPLERNRIAGGAQVAAQLFRDMALTVSFSLIASLAVALTLIPMLAAILGRESVVEAPVAPALPPAKGFFGRLHRYTLVTMRWLSGTCVHSNLGRGGCSSGGPM